MKTKIYILWYSYLDFITSYLDFIKKSTNISSFKGLLKTWDRPQCQCLIAVPLIKDYVSQINILCLILYKKCFSVCK